MAAYNAANDKPEVKHPDFGLPTMEEHNRISALFLGPKGENVDFLKSWFDTIVEEQQVARLKYFPEDEPTITKETQESKSFKDQAELISAQQKNILEYLGMYSVPFYSPRYSAHMCVDQSLPAILAYISTMFYNPNNVAFEASPLTTLAELEVGLELCEMMGYNRYNDVLPDENGVVEPLAWGHIACDGSVANLESMWAARNLKFYGLALREAIAPGKELEFIRDSFVVETCDGTQKLLKDCSVWEMLNFKTKTVLDIPERLTADYGISQAFLNEVMKEYIVQSINKDAMMEKWWIEKQPVVMASTTKHYSWPKAAAITGIGSKNLLDVPLDRSARMDPKELDELLKTCLKEQRAVLQIVALREKYEKLGMTFVVHADAAWGGYFASMLPRRVRPRASDPQDEDDDDRLMGVPPSVPDSDMSKQPPYVPAVGLRTDTAHQLAHLRLADSITVDPHKAGYVPYPAGALCYRDARMKNLLTWTAVYIHQGSSEGESIGVYGVEGSKPGAAPMAVFMAHQSIGLGPKGHGSLLAQAMYTCRRFAAHWSAMSTEHTSFVVTPFNHLPAEDGPNPTPEVIEADRQFIRDRILNKSNTELEKDYDARVMLNKLGSDLNINVFACNFRYSDGRLNTDVEEANWLNRRIFERLSVISAEQDPLKIPFYVTSTTFSQREYGVAADDMRRRMGLEGKQDLVVLRNVAMSPFTTKENFVGKMADVFRQVLEEEVENVRRRNEVKPKIHSFLVNGTGPDVFLVHTATNHMASGRRQIILRATLKVKLGDSATSLGHSVSKVRVIQSAQPLLLDDIIDGGEFEFKSVPSEVDGSSMHLYVSDIRDQVHIDHVILKIPNIHLGAGQLSCAFDPPLSPEDLALGVVAVATNVREAAMQPFPLMKDMKSDSFFFREGKKLLVTVYKDPYPASTTAPIQMKEFKEVITTGEITLKGDIFIDSDALNDASEAKQEVPVMRTKAGKMREDHVKGWKEVLSMLKARR